MTKKKLKEWERITCSFYGSLEKAIYNGKGRYADLSCRDAHVLFAFAFSVFGWLDDNDPLSKSSKISDILNKYRNLPDSCIPLIPNRIEYMMIDLMEYNRQNISRESS